MCFGRKPKAPSTASQSPSSISAPLHNFATHEKNPTVIQPNTYSTSTRYRATIRPSRNHQPEYPPKPVPNFDSNWRGTSDGPPSTAGKVHALAGRWLKVSSGKNRIFRNAGLDGRGRLKLEYQDLEEVDWGEPLEWRKSYRG